MQKYKPSGVCSQEIHFKITNDTLSDVAFLGGCDGSLQGIGILVEGMPVAEAISKLETIHCGFKSTSCPAELAKALKSASNL